jgi:uncharacterized protein with von Willebrand factor type A (vWA) domain
LARFEYRQVDARSANVTHPPPNLPLEGGGGKSRRGIEARLAQFAAALRAHAIRVGLGDEIDAARGLTLLDLLDRREVRDGLRIALKVPHEAWATFDSLFEAHWGGEQAQARPAPRREVLRDHRGPPRFRLDGKQVRLVTAGAPDQGAGEDAPGYSPEALLRRKPFNELSAGELASMERLLARLALRLATRRGRRLVPTRGRGTVDIRRSFREALGTEGALLDLARRTRALEHPRLVLLYDTSGSMDPYTRVLLAFALALRRVMKRVEVFTFNTALTRVTGLLAPTRIPQTLERLAAGVPDWSGGTRIGACLSDFVASHLARMVARDTTIVLVSDGLDLGDTGELAAAMRALHERAGRIVWLNPLMGDARYRPTAAGMSAALPYVDYLGPAHNLEALERLLRVVR